MDVTSALCQEISEVNKEWKLPHLTRPKQPTIVKTNTSQYFKFFITPGSKDQEHPVKKASQTRIGR